MSNPTVQNRTFDPALVINQLGGYSRLSAMIGARDFVKSDKDCFVVFKFGKGTKGINCLRVTLNLDDLYDLEFIKIPGMAGMRNGNFPVTIATHADVHCESLVSVFESETGLLLNLFGR